MIETDFKRFASEYFGIKDRLVTLSSKLSDLQKDVHDLVIFSYEIERRFGVELQEEETEKIRTIGDYVKLLRKKSASQEKRNAA